MGDVEVEGVSRVSLILKREREREREIIQSKERETTSTFQSKHGSLSFEPDGG